MSDLTDLRDRLRDFARERDWEKFHTPKNLTAAIAGEAGELVSVLQWVETDELTASHRVALKDEMADVLIYLVRLADVVDVNLAEAAQSKIATNEARFPPHDASP